MTNQTLCLVLFITPSVTRCFEEKIASFWWEIAKFVATVYKYYFGFLKAQNIYIKANVKTQNIYIKDLQNLPNIYIKEQKLFPYLYQYLIFQLN